MRTPARYYCACTGQFPGSRPLFSFWVRSVFQNHVLMETLAARSDLAGKLAAIFGFAILCCSWRAPRRANLRLLKPSPQKHPGVHLTLARQSRTCFLSRLNFQPMYVRRAFPLIFWLSAGSVPGLLGLHITVP